MPGQNLYFASDFHLGTDGLSESSQEREKKIVRWLDYIKDDCKTLFLVGDCFDFWFEFKEVIPKGNIRFLGKLAELRDLGIEIHLFHGNHDMWIKDYFTTELGIIIHASYLIFEHNGKRIFISHGDGLGPGDRKYKILKRVLRNPLNKWLFARLHPNFSVKLMRWISQKKGKLGIKQPNYQGKEKEWLYLFCEKYLKNNDYVDYFIFGHRHLVIDLLLDNQKSRYINLGDMISFNSYAVYKDNSLSVKSFENEHLEIITS